MDFDIELYGLMQILVWNFEKLQS